VITGGSGTIGKAIAVALVGRGMCVYITGRRKDALEVAKTEILAQACEKVGSVEVFQGDVTIEESVVALFAEVNQKRGRCDLLINNAGIGIGGPTVNITAADFSKVMSVNVLGPFLCAREAMKSCIASGGGGRIINIGSITAFAPRADACPYACSKYAIDGLTRSLSIDGRQHQIAVGQIHPGNVLSDIMSPEEAARREKAEGFISGEDVAVCVLTMASLPYTANILELTVLPTRQPLVGRG